MPAVERILDIESDIIDLEPKVIQTDNCISPSWISGIGNFVNLRGLLGSPLLITESQATNEFD